MISTLRGRLFAAILAIVLVAVAVSLGIGIALTRSAVRSSFADQLSREADLLSGAAASARRPAVGVGFLEALAPPGEAIAPALPAPGVRRGRRPGAGTLIVPGPAGAQPFPPGSESTDRPLTSVLTLGQARSALPAAAVADLEANGKADGRAEIDGSDQLFSARVTDGAAKTRAATGSQGHSPQAVLLLTRSAAVGGEDFAPYLGGLLLASGLAGLLAAVAAALIARRLSAPIRRVSSASGELARGQRPDKLPETGPRELANLARSFNEMATQLERAREAERSVLLSVSHELRTPLTAIRGYAEGVEDGAVEPREAGLVITAEAGRLERLVQDLLALARLDQGVLEFRREPIDLAQIAAQARRRLALPAAEREVKVTLDANGSAEAIGDPDRALQVISNLIENAIRVTPPNGTVSIAVAPGSVIVSDTGPGIPAKDIPHAFDRFHLRRNRGNSSDDGSGLGLAIVRELTEGMGGRVELRSEPGRGAEFTVRLIQESKRGVMTQP